MEPSVYYNLVYPALVETIYHHDSALPKRTSVYF